MGSAAWRLLLLLVAGLPGAPGTGWAAETAVAAGMPVPSLGDLFSVPAIIDVALAPSGRHAAAVLMVDGSFHLAVLDLGSGQQEVILRLHESFADDKTVGMIQRVAWKSDDRLLFWTAVQPKAEANIWIGSEAFGKLGSRIFAIDRDGSHIVRLLGESRDPALAGAMNLGNVVSWLPQDPDHVLLFVRGLLRSPALYRVSVADGKGELVAQGTPSTAGWWIDADGLPTVRVQEQGGALSLWKPDGDGRWQRFLDVPAKDAKALPSFLFVAPSDQPSRFWVLARPDGRDRIGVYLFDLATASFGQPVAEHPRYDLATADVSPDGSQLLRTCHLADVWTCEYTNPLLDAHLRGVRRYFGDRANVHPLGFAEDAEGSMLVSVEGPGHAPAYYHYRASDRKIMPIGIASKALAGKALAQAVAFRWTSRDGLQLRGYLTRPAGATEADRLPLVVMPHDVGASQRDALRFDPAVQYLAARGYAVFQPNFRGSGGFGEAFARLGDGEWGRRMQDDISDGLLALVKAGFVDGERVCIVGSGYGGYAALAGVVLTPALYRCAIATAGISDLAGYLKSRKKQLGGGSDLYQYWSRLIAGPRPDTRSLDAVSPARLAGRIKAPVLLMHGTADDVVPLEQSERMQKNLVKAGNPAQLMRLPGMRHPPWPAEGQMLELIAIDRFLWQQLGPGHGSSTPPPELPAIAGN